MTGCRFVQVADLYTWSFQACTSFFSMSIKKKLITQAIKLATVSIIFSACARVACRFQSMQTIIFDYQCDSVSSTAVKFGNHSAAFQHSLPILITDGEKLSCFTLPLLTLVHNVKNVCKFPYCGLRPLARYSVQLYDV